MKTKKWMYFGFGLLCLYFFEKCGGCGNDSDSSNSSTYVDDSFSWLQGTWVCNSEYGSIIVEIDGDHIREDYGNGDVFSGTYQIYDGAIHPNTNSHAYYPLDMSARKIGDGRGGFFRKR